MKRIDVKVPNKNYPIFIGNQLETDLLAPFVENKQVLVVTNTTVAPLYQSWIRGHLTAAKQVECFELFDGESHKTMQSLEQILDCLMELNFNRDCVVVALGGGVVGDLAGFAAASFQRGVDFIQVPTTLLAQVDSSVGGKTGVNHRLGKNMIGAFKQPKAVLIDTSCLTTLPQRELSAGLAEVIKYALIRDSEFLYWLELHMEDLLNLKPEATAEAILRSCKHKAQIVEEDELESGVRALLNFGHTFGHAIEADQGYGSWLHGEAVAAGMVQASVCSEQMGWISPEDLERVKHVITLAKLPVKPPLISVERAMELMGHDKKVKNGKIRFVLLKGIGNALVTADVPKEALNFALNPKAWA